MTKNDQLKVVQGMGLQISKISDEYASKICEKILTTVDSVISDNEMNVIEKFAVIKVVVDSGWKRVVAISEGDSTITPTDLSKRHLSTPTGDEGMDRKIRELLGRELE